MKTSKKIEPSKDKLSILYINISLRRADKTVFLYPLIFTTGPALVAVCALQQSVGVLAAALMKT